MKRVVFAIVCLLGSAVRAEPIVVLAPPVADSPQLAEVGLLMQAEAGRWLIATGRKELHVKQLLRTLERHHLTVEQLASPDAAARARKLLGASTLVWGKLSQGADGYSLEVRIDGGEARRTALGGSLLSAIAAGAHALTAAVGKDGPPGALGTSNDAAASHYAHCYAVLIRQPISVESPTVLSASELASAVKSCRSAVGADPKFEDAWAALGLAQAISGQDADAVQALLKVHAAERYQPLYWLGRYWLVTRYQSPAAGETALRQALKQHPGFLLARGYLAEHLMVMGRNDEALEVWKQYSSELPDNAFLRGRVSATLARLGKHDEAIAAAKAALELDHSDGDAVLELGSRYLDAGKRDQAIEVLQAAASGNSRGDCCSGSAGPTSTKAI
jgi:cytochrome c-type biogenesis protein CcmH/NrfG